MKKHVFLLAPVVAYMAVVFAFSSQSSIYPVGTLDWLAHFVEYLGLGALMTRAALGYGFRKWRAAIISVAAGVLFGISDEIHQAFTPDRAAELRDLIADTGGVTVGAAGWLWLKAWRGRNDDSAV